VERRELIDDNTTRRVLDVTMINMIADRGVPELEEVADHRIMDADHLDIRIMVAELPVIRITDVELRVTDAELRVMDADRRIMDHRIIGITDAELQAVTRITVADHPAVTRTLDADLQADIRVPVADHPADPRITDADHLADTRITVADQVTVTDHRVRIVVPAATLTVTDTINSVAYQTKNQKRLMIQLLILFVSYSSLIFLNFFNCLTV